MSWSGDGKRLSYRTRDLRRIGLIDLTQQRESFVQFPDSLGAGYTGGAVLSPDGGQLVISTIHRWNDWSELWLASREGAVLSRVAEPFGESYPLRWTTDGWLYLINNHAQLTDAGEFRLELWRVRMPRGKPEFVAPIPEACSSFSLSRDGTRGACGYNTRQSDLMITSGFDPGSD